MSFASELSRQIHGLDVFAGFVPTFPEDLQGWNSDSPVFAEIIPRSRPRIVVDVGVWKGGSTIVLANFMREHDIDGAVIAVDTFLGSPEHRGSKLFALRHGRPLLYEQFLSNIVLNNAQNLVIPLPQTSANAAILLRQLGVAPDLVHIDAAHDYDSVLSDARAYWEILATGGYLIGDDYHETWPDVVAAANRFAREAGAELRVVAPKWIIHKRHERRRFRDAIRSVLSKNSRYRRTSPAFGL